MKNILVTGGAGFIGTNLCTRLVNDPDNYVYCLDSFYSGKYSNLDYLVNYPNFELIEEDIRMLKFDKPIDEIYNLACPASPPIYQVNPLFTFETNIIGVNNLIKLALKYKAKILQASTSEIYGDPLEHPQKEGDWGHVNPIGIRSCYDEGKRGAECLLACYKELGLKASIVRIFNTYGPFMNKDDGRVISNFINQAIQGKDITIYGDGSQTRSFCYIDDLIEGLIRTMNTDCFGPINLGNPNEIKISDIANHIIKLTKSKSNIIFTELPQDDPVRRKPDITKAKTVLNWHPVVDLKSGLIKTIEYYRRIQ